MPRGDQRSPEPMDEEADVVVLAMAAAGHNGH